MRTQKITLTGNKTIEALAPETPLEHSLLDEAMETRLDKWRELLAKIGLTVDASRLDTGEPAYTGTISKKEFSIESFLDGTLIYFYLVESPRGELQLWWDMPSLEQSNRESLPVFPDEFEPDAFASQ